MKDEERRANRRGRSEEDRDRRVWGSEAK